VLQRLTGHGSGSHSFLFSLRQFFVSKLSSRVHSALPKTKLEIAAHYQKGKWCGPAERTRTKE